MNKKHKRPFREKGVVFIHDFSERKRSAPPQVPHFSEPKHLLRFFIAPIGIGGDTGC